MNIRASLKTFTMAALAAGLAFVVPASAQQLQSRLFEITKNKSINVCQYPLYYSISYRDPASNELIGIDVDLAKELAKELGAELNIVESSFGTFIADLQAGKCEIGMFGIGATLQRATAVEFSNPYLITDIHGVVRENSKVAKWADVDQAGVKVGVLLGSYIETFMKGYLKNAELVSIAPPNTREGELVAGRVDILMVDYPTVVKVQSEFDWARTLQPDEKLAATPFAYVVPQGDQVWLNFVNLFIDTVKRDGRLAKFAEKNKLGPIVAP